VHSKTLNQIFPNVTAYHNYVPSFGEWGFCLAGNNDFSIKRKLNGLKFYNYQFAQLAYFEKDMLAKNVEVNQLQNQILVRYFDEEWSKVQ
jgi:spermidine synthase